MALTLKGKVAIVTGASSGIGRATAIHFAKLGCSLSLTGRDEVRLKAVKAQCMEEGALPESAVLSFVADVTNEEDNTRVVNSTVEAFHKLDILVNSAGSLLSDNILQLEKENLDKMLKEHVYSVSHMMKLCTPHLTLTKGSIVNVSSVCGIRPFPNILSYCIAKSAEDQLTQCTAMELAPKGVRVNSVNPGVIETQVHKRAGMSPEAYSAFLERAKQTHALGRHGQPEEVAKAVAFLASDDASFITGVTLPVDGGRHAMAPR